MNTEQTKPMTVQGAKDEAVRPKWENFESFMYFINRNLIPASVVDEITDKAILLYHASQKEADVAEFVGWLFDSGYHEYPHPSNEYQWRRFNGSSLEWDLFTTKDLYAKFKLTKA